MKVYVDELPKSCGDCKFKVFIAHYQNGWEHSERYCSIMKDNYDCRCSKEHCPLQSLADHDKQVRKQVCDEIKQKLRKQYPNVYANIGESLFCSDCYLRIRELSEILDQIQGENNGNTNNN